MRRLQENRSFASFKRLLVGFGNVKTGMKGISSEPADLASYLTLLQVCFSARVVRAFLNCRAPNNIK